MHRRSKSIENSISFLSLSQRLFWSLFKSALRRLVVFLVVITLAVQAARAAVNLTLNGEIHTHDPSALIQDVTTGRYYYYTTNNYMYSRYSTNIFSANPSYWYGSSTGVFNSSTLPAWTIPFTTDSGGVAHNGDLWAPDIAYLNGQYYLYYSASSWGSKYSAIGMATSPSLSSPVWTDHGIVISSTGSSAYNTIDPSILKDNDGSLWMTYGSYFTGGIYLVQLNSTLGDPNYGMRISPSSTTTRLADTSDIWHDSLIEASRLTRRGNFYYLFVNWGAVLPRDQ